MAISQQNKILFEFVANTRSFTGDIETAARAVDKVTQGQYRLNSANVLVEASTGNFVKQTKANTIAQQALSAEIQRQTTIAGASTFALTSLGQGLADAGQFANGTAQGIRAVTNNVQQFGTAFAFLTIQANGTANAFKAMWASLSGPLGVLFAFQAVTAAIDAYSQFAARAKKETNELADALEEAAGQMIKFEEMDFEEFRVEDEEIEKFLGILDQQLANNEQLEKDTKSLTRLERLLNKEKVTSGRNVELIQASVAEKEAEINALKEQGATLDEGMILAQNTLKTQLEERQRTLKANLLLEEAARETGLEATNDEESAREARLASFNEIAQQAQTQLDLASELPPIFQEEIELLRLIEELQKEIEKAAAERLKREEAIRREILGQVADAQSMAAAGEIENLPDIPGLDLPPPEEVETRFERMADSGVKAGQMIGQAMGQAGTAIMQLAKTGEETDMRLFKMGKKIAIATAVVNTATGITRAYKDLPFWAAIPASAVIAAAGAAQIAAIRAAQPGSSSSPRSSRSAPTIFSGPNPNNLSQIPGTNTPFAPFMLDGAPVPGPNVPMSRRTDVQFVVDGRNLIGVINNNVEAMERTTGKMSTVGSSNIGGLEPILTI